MKKIALLLALLLCLVPVLSACGAGGGGGVKAVKKYLDARFVDFDKDAFDEVYLRFNKDLLKENLESEQYDAVAYSGWRDSTHSYIKDTAKYVEKAKKYDFNYEIYDSRTVKEKDEEFDVILEQLYLSTQSYENKVYLKDTDFEDKIEEFCLVRVLGLETWVNDSKEERIAEYENTLLSIKIDGKWYVYGYLSYGNHYDGEDAVMEEWLK